MSIERSRTGVYRLPLFRGWAVGISADWWPPFSLTRYEDGGWSVRLLWFHFGRKDRSTWSHYRS
jgi:hypothetical protein